MGPPLVSGNTPVEECFEELFSVGPGAAALTETWASAGAHFGKDSLFHRAYGRRLGTAHN